MARSAWRFALLASFLLLLVSIVPLEAKKAGKKKKAKKPKDDAAPPAVATTVHKGKTIVSLKCQACETTTVSAHQALLAAQNDTALLTPPSYWKARLVELCGAQAGCKDFLGKDSLSALSQEMADLKDDKDATPGVHELQESFCFEITASCPDGTEARTKRHQFEPVPGWTANMINLRFKSALSEESLRVYWVDPAKPHLQPDEPTAILSAGHVSDQNSYRFHQFRLLPPGVEWGDRKRRIDVQITHEDPYQVYEISQEVSFVEGVPETMPDPEASQPAEWSEEDDGPWQAPDVPNPLASVKKFKVSRLEAREGWMQTGVREEL